MTQHPLPMTDPDRTEFGFQRTVCACPECVQNCRHLPGYLIPADLGRIQQHLAAGEDLLAWARHHLRASPGAMVLHQGRAFRIPTLVPARRADGACLFLADQDRCQIHAVAPFGCAFFDAHQAHEEADRRSRRGLQAVAEAWRRGDPFAQVWRALHQAGLHSPPPEVCRRQLHQATDNDQPP